MINLIANKKFKKLGCKWTGKEWMPPEVAIEDFEKVKREFFEDLIIIKVIRSKDNTNFLKAAEMGIARCILIGGYSAASCFSNDSQIKLGEEVALIEGEINARGSRKNYFVDYSDEFILKMKVSRHAIKYIKKEVKENRYSYEVVKKG